MPACCDSPSSYGERSAVKCCLHGGPCYGSFNYTKERCDVQLKANLCSGCGAASGARLSRKEQRYQCCHANHLQCINPAKCSFLQILLLHTLYVTVGALGDENGFRVRK